MEKEYTQEEIDAIIDTLPEDVKDAIFSVNTAKIINEIGKKYGLHIDQMGDLGTATGDILLGITRPTDFVDNLQTKLKIERVRASEVAAEINEKIFSKVRDSLRALRGDESAGKEVPNNAEKNENAQYTPRKEDILEAIQRPEMYSRPQTPEIRSPIDKAPTPTLEVEPLIPQKPKPTDLLSQKLSGPISIPKSETNKSSDPYREAF